MPETFTGTCAFRLMPQDDLAEGPSTATIEQVAPTQWLVRYTWTHPLDGNQHGVLLVGGPDEGAHTVGASLADSWHQNPGLMTLAGTVDGTGVRLSAQYAGDWGWEVDLDGLGTDAPSMTMRNVVPASALEMLPEDAPPVEAGPYDVMVARWRSASA